MTSPVVIAEIGVNHVGDAGYAEEYVTQLLGSNIYAVTFQVHSPVTTTSDETDAAVLRSRLLPDDFYRTQFKRLKDAGIKVGIATTDYFGLPFFQELGLDFVKTLGADITCMPLFERLAEMGIMVHVSTAWATIPEIEQALSMFKDLSKVKLIYTDGIAGAKGNTHLQSIEYFRKRFQVPVAYGKHSESTDILFAALAYHPELIYLYVKGDRDVKHPDDAHAIPLKELPSLMQRIEFIAAAVATTPDDKLFDAVAPEKAQKQRRRLVASQNIAAGEILTSQNLAATRPAGDVSSQHYVSLCGRQAKRAYNKGESISASELS